MRNSIFAAVSNNVIKPQCELTFRDEKWNLKVKSLLREDEKWNCTTLLAEPKNRGSIPDTQNGYGAHPVSYTVNVSRAGTKPTNQPI